MHRNKIAYLLFLIFSGVISILYNEYFMSVVFIAVILLPLFLGGIAATILYFLKTDLELPNSSIGKGEAFSVAVHVKNPTIFPITKLCLELSYKNEITDYEKKETVTLAMDMRSSRRIDFKLSSNHCGTIQFKIKKVRVYDYFQMLRLSKKQNTIMSIPVTPPIHEIKEDFIEDNFNLVTDCETENFSKHKPGNDPSEVFGIREYREGDRASRIHWKLSYKQDNLMIKEFSEPIKDSTAILMDFYLGHDREKRLCYYDGLLETVMSVSNACLGYGHPHKLHWCRTDGSYAQLKITEPGEYYEVLTALLKEKPGNTISLLTTEYIQSRDKAVNVIYITTHITEESITQLLQGVEGAICYIFHIKEEDAVLHKELSEFITGNSVRIYEILLKDLKGSINQIGRY